MRIPKQEVDCDLRVVGWWSIEESKDENLFMTFPFVWYLNIWYSFSSISTLSDRDSDEADSFLTLFLWPPGDNQKSLVGISARIFFIGLFELRRVWSRRKNETAEGWEEVAEAARRRGVWEYQDEIPIRKGWNRQLHLVIDSKGRTSWCRRGKALFGRRYLVWEGIGVLLSQWRRTLRSAVCHYCLGRLRERKARIWDIWY